MDQNGFYSFDQNTLPQRAVTDFSVPAGNSGSDAAFQELPDGPLDPLFGLPGYQPPDQSKLQQPANDPFALDSGELDFGHFGSLNQASELLNGPLLGLNDYESCNQTPFTNAPATNQFRSGLFNDIDIAFGGHYSFNQMTLPQSPGTDMFALNAPFSSPGFYSVDQNAFGGTLFAAGSVIDATLQSSESGPISGLEATPTSSIMLSHAPPLPHATRPSKLNCDWPGCNSAEVFPDQITRSQHISTIHVKKVLQDGSGGTCKWPGCTKTKLDTSKKLELHVTNIHLEPLLCTAKDCRRTEPFGRKGELDRHISSIHKQGRTFKCPRKDCDRHIRGFPRKDKLDLHIRCRRHGTFPCQYSHCSFRENTPFMTQAELASHYDDHGNLECGIDSCKDKISAFSLQNFSWHLFIGHRYWWKDYFGQETHSLGLITESVKQFVERSQGATSRVFECDLEGLDFEFKYCVNCRLEDSMVV